MEKVSDRMRRVYRAPEPQGRRVGAVLALGLTLFVCAGMALCLMLALSGCSGTSAGGSSGSASSGAAQASSDAESAAGDGTSAGIDVSGMDLEYTSRDRDAGYDASSATHVVLADGATQVEGANGAVRASPWRATWSR